MQEADEILQQLRGQGFVIQTIGDEGHWFMFAVRDGIETSVRGGDFLRVAKALTVAIGLDSHAAHAIDDGDASEQRRA